MITPELKIKLDKAKTIVKNLNSSVVAYSGGVDSTLLMNITKEVLADNCIAVMVKSALYPAREYKPAIDWLIDNNIKYLVIESDEMSIPGFADNNTDRCYICKTRFFDAMWNVAKENNLLHVIDGSNADDTKDYRPGSIAAKEQNIISPLKEAGLVKSDIRMLAEEIYNLKVAQKPSLACFATRFPYGSKITDEKLNQVIKMEYFLYDEGFKSVRARHHEDTLRIEVGVDEISKLLDNKLRELVVDFAKALGFTYITLDLQGFRTGSMNEILNLI